MVLAVLEMGHYMPVYHTRAFVPEFHTGTYKYIMYPFVFFVFLAVYPFAFKSYTGTSKLPPRALSITNTGLPNEITLSYCTLTKDTL
jgi:hypothetical protein